MDGSPLGKRCKAKTPRGEDNLLLAIYRTNHEVLPMDIQRHETRGWRGSLFCEHLLLLSALRKQSGWMRCVIRACGKSLTNTSLTTRVVSVQVIGRATKQRDGHRCPMRKLRLALTPRTTAASPPVNTRACPRRLFKRLYAVELSLSRSQSSQQADSA